MITIQNALPSGVDHAVEEERAAAEANLPAGHQLISTGKIQAGDLIWQWVRREFIPVRIPKPFVRGQKRPGYDQFTEIGNDVSRYVAVARPIPTTVV